MYPAEIEILQQQMSVRKDYENDTELYNAVIAARVPMMKDAGKKIIDQIVAKHAAPDMGQGVTSETRKRDLQRARAFLKRHSKKK